MQLEGRRPTEPRSYRAMVDERNRLVQDLLRATGARERLAGRPLVVDVGSGGGGPLLELLQAGDGCGDPRLIVGTDLDPGWLAKGAREFTGEFISFVQTDVTALPLPDGCADLVVCFTLFSSITDPAAQEAGAAEVTRVLAPGGVLAWFDFRYPSPRNHTVRPVSRARLRALFPGLSGQIRSTTLLPPVARRLGSRTDRLYPLLVRVPVLRSHLAAVLRKPS